MRTSLIGLLWLAIASVPAVSCAAEKASSSPQEAKNDGSTAEQVQEKLNALPGIEVNLKQGYVDAAGKICLDEGMLELIATNEGGKEHESIIALKAKAKHIHLALLMLGAKPGTPPHWKYIEAQDRWLGIPPKGDLVRLSLVYRDGEGKERETPISEFIQNREGEQLTTSDFIFAGSRIAQSDDGKKNYMADVDGNIVSVSSFGDETLCLPEPASNANDQLIWEIDAEKLPRTGSAATLRMRPVGYTPPEKKDEGDSKAETPSKKTRKTRGNDTE